MSLDAFKSRLTTKPAPVEPVKRLGFVPKSLTQHPHPDDMGPLSAAATPSEGPQGYQRAVPIVTISAVQPISVNDRVLQFDIQQASQPPVEVAPPEPSLTFYQAPGTHTPVCVLLGPGGTGKTYRIQRYQQENEDEKVLLTATTGVAAINIGPSACTINSAMKFFSEETLKENLTKPHIMQMVWSSFAPLTLLVIDEVSMLSSGVLEKIYDFIESINRDRAARGAPPLKLLLSGDFCQLPPVAEGTVPFAFHARQWEKVFEPAIIKLTRNYRQASDPDFQRALHRCRIGDSAGAVNDLKCNYSKTINYNFPGLTLYSVNKEVDAHNTKKLRELETDPFYDIPQKWGEQDKDWKSIPDPLIVKIGAQVRVTANLSNEGPGSKFVYVNGDIGSLGGYTPGKHAQVKLNRGETVHVGPVTRMNFKPLGQKERPPEFCNGIKVPLKFSGQDRGGYEAYIEGQSMRGRVWFHPKERKWVIGEIRFVPIMLGWASSVHRCLHPDSVVMEKNGIAMIGDIKIGDFVFDGKSYVRVKGLHYTEQKLGVLSGERKSMTIKCSPEHRFMGRDSWICASDINGVEVKRFIDRETWTRAVYEPSEKKCVMVDIEVDSEDHAFIANGFVTHNSQGLTVTQLQIDIRPQFSGSPQMMYVALSRCTSASGIVITRGDQHKLQSRISVHREVVKYV